MITKKILILDNEPGHQILVAKLLRRSFSCEITFASSLDEAKDRIQYDQFNIITLDGCLFHDEFGFQLIPAIREVQNKYCIIIMISSLEDYINAGLKLHADYGFLKQDIIMCKGQVKFTEQFDVIPYKCDIYNNIWKSVGLSTDFFLTIETISL